MFRRLSIIITLLLAVSLDTMADDINYTGWMASLPDDMFLTNMSIPGTHDSGTKGYSFNAATQDLSISDQLQHGVRAFDLRPGVNGSSLVIYHGNMVHGSETLGSIMTTLTTFLAEHPTECIIVLTKKEYDSGDKWAGLMKSTLEPFGDYFVDFVPYLTLGQMRGKILLLNRDSYDADINRANQDGGWSDNATFDMGWRGNSGDYMATRIQDIYDATSKIDQKKSDIVTLMDECMKGNTHKLYINHTSGYTANWYTDNRKLADCAEKCNEVAINYLKDHTGPVGLIMMDFAGVDHVSYVGSSCDTRGQILIDALINNCYTTAADATASTWIAPMGAEHPWKGRYYYKDDSSNSSTTLDALSAPATSWKRTTFDDTTWNEQVFPMGSVNYGDVYCSRWTGEYNTFWIRREFTLDKVDTSRNYFLKAYHDDDYEIYVNGHKIDSADGWTTPGSPVVKKINLSYLLSGKNVIGIHIQQNWGGAYFDCGVYDEENPEAAGVSEVQAESNQALYDLQGRRVNNPVHGIYIQSGRKIMR